MIKKGLLLLAVIAVLVNLHDSLPEPKETTCRKQHKDAFSDKSWYDRLWEGV